MCYLSMPRNHLYQNLNQKVVAGMSDTRDKLIQLMCMFLSYIVCTPDCHFY